MDQQNLDQITDEELQEITAKHMEYVIGLEPEELYERILKAYESTEVILEGYNLVTNINEGHGIAIAGLIRSRAALEDVMTWMDSNLLDEVDTNDESDEL